MAAEIDNQRLRLVGETTAPPAVLLEAGLDVAYQPIVHLGSGSVIAYEALARPRHPEARNPLVFFGALEQGGLRLSGERSAFAAALGGAQEGFPRVKLFVNASPLTLVDPEFDVLELLDLAEAHGRLASDLVIEVTESEAVDDLAALARRIRRLRRLGIGVAVDDAGAGHASFRVITRLRPSFIKIDRDLVSNVDTDGARHAFIEAMVRFARQIGSRLIAEGIETEGELASLAALGVEAGQGYFLARPAQGRFVNPSTDSRRMIAAAAQRLRLGTAQVTVGELVRPPAVIDRSVSVREAYARFLADPSLGLLVVCEDGRVSSQVTRRALERYLSGPGAWERLAEKPVVDIAEQEPLTVVAQLDVVEVGTILAARQTQEVVDDVVVTDPRGVLIGVAPLRTIIRTLTELRRHDDRKLHPLTGLFGLSWVEEELSHRMEVDDPTTVVFVDVDGFRALNDLGGFAMGDEVIRALGRCLTGVAGGVAGAAAAHVGGDDFVLLVPPRGYEELVGEVVRSFETEVMPFLRTELRLRDAGQLADMVSLSMAAVDLAGDPPPGHRYLDWARDRLTVSMRTAKNYDGYSCVHHGGAVTTVSTWTATGDRTRVLSLGLAEPAVVLRALDLVDESWRAWWEAGSADDDTRVATFPGPRATVERLQAVYAEPLRAQAEAALADRLAVMEVTLTGQETDLLELLDRLALITRAAYATRRLPIPPELALLDRLLRQRARVITRQDVLTEQEIG